MKAFSFLAAGLALVQFAPAAEAAQLASATPPASAAHPAMRTQWRITQSSGLDAIAFLGPLSGDPFYAESYGPEIAEFRPKLPRDFQTRIAKLSAEAKTRDILLTPILALILSGSKDTRLDGLIAALADPEKRLKPAFAADSNWDLKQWQWFVGVSGEVRLALEQMRSAGFEPWWHGRYDAVVAKRQPELERYLARYDVIAEQEWLTGRRFDPHIHIITLNFVKPHGVKVQGQTFLTSFDYPNEIIVANAAHEMLHPPIDMAGPTAKRLIALVERDPVLTSAIRDHDKSFGYTTVDGVVNEDLVQALEQTVCDRINCGRSAVYRWNHADDGMHLIAAGIYGLLNEHAYPFMGGNFERWLASGMDSGWLTTFAIRRSAARILGRPVERLWPAPK